MKQQLLEVEWFCSGFRVSSHFLQFKHKDSWQSTLGPSNPTVDDILPALPTIRNMP